MKIRWFLPVLLATASLAFLAGVGFSDDEKPSDEEMMKKMMELGKPGPAHEILKGMVGDWDTVAKIWMAPGSEPDVSKGTAMNKLMLDGRFLYQSFDGTFGGMPHHGFGFMGHDNWKKTYENVWIDNFGSALSVARGKAREDGKSIELAWEWDGPMGKIPGRYVYTVVGPDCYTIEGWMTQGGQEMKSMEIKMTRKK